MITISLQTSNGHFLIANSDDTIAATPDGVGSWELFQVFRPDGTMAASLNHNDRISLRSHFGKFLMAANAGGATLGAAGRIQSWETFTIEKLSGTGEIAHSNLVTLRAFDGRHFIMAVNGGGGDVSCASTNRAGWETFAVQFWNSSLMHIKAHDNHFLCAEDGGGREINANRITPVTWETFRLINRSRATGLFSGDAVVFQTWNAKFLSATAGGGGTVMANQNRAATLETFRINKIGGGVINPGDQVSFQASNGRHFLMAEDGGGNIVNAMASLAREWETFTIVAAQNLPIQFANTPTAPAIPGNPFMTPPARLTGPKKIVALLFGFQDSLADDSITPTDFQNAIFGPTQSLKSWFEHNCYGAMTLEGRAFGPFNVPWRYHTDPVTETNAYFNGILTEAERMGFSFDAFDTGHDRVVSSEEVMFVLLDCSGAFLGGNSGPASFTFRGITYNGLRLNVGLFPRGGSLHGMEQLNRALCTVAHELCHIFFGYPDRYYAPMPPRGDVEATSVSRIDRALHKIEFINSNAANVRIKTVHGTYWKPDGTTGNLLNGDGIASNLGSAFELSLPSGSSAIRHLDSIRIRSTSLARYVMANWGGGDTVSVVASAASSWETFTIERQSGAGTLQNGDMVYFKTSTRNPFGESYYLLTQPFRIPEDPFEPNARHNDRETLERGWWTSWNFSSAGGGVGGDYDVMDNDKKKGLMSAYDRLKKGWISPRVLTPENKAWYILRPSIDAAEAVVLWDPLFPEEWYVIENRQNRANEDVIPSSGLIITWINENPAYWLNWHRTDDIRMVVPSVISAANPSLPPNAHVQPMLQNYKYYKRAVPETAFRSGQVLLPRGDGSASRFILEFRVMPAEQMAFSIR